MNVHVNRLVDWSVDNCVCFIEDLAIGLGVTGGILGVALVGGGGFVLYKNM